MILYEILSHDEVELFKLKYDNFKNKLNNIIINSGLFQKGYIFSSTNLMFLQENIDDFYLSNSFCEIPNPENRYSKLKQHCISIKTNETSFVLEDGQLLEKWNPIVITVIRKDNIRIKKSFFNSTEEFDIKEETFTPLYIERKVIKGGEQKNFKYYKTKLENEIIISNSEKLFLNKFFKTLSEHIKEIKNEINSINSSLIESQDNLINELDKNNDGIIDLIDFETFNKLLNKNQKKIIEVDKTYIQKFVKISIYLKTKKENIQIFFDNIKRTKNQNELSELIKLLQNQIHTYELLLLHSINMIVSLTEDELITFYEIYECFDQLGVFNSSWENEVSNKLLNIGDGIKDLMFSIQKMEFSLVSSINNLTYITQDSFKNLSNSVEKQLTSVNSSIRFNNFLTGIQTYQMFRIN